MALESAESTTDGARRDVGAPSATSGPPLLRARRRVRVLFINDTARNGGPGRSLFYILRFLDPDVVERCVVLPRPGVISELYETRGATSLYTVDTKVKHIESRGQVLAEITPPIAKKLRKEGLIR